MTLTDLLLGQGGHGRITNSSLVFPQRSARPADGMGADTDGHFLLCPLRLLAQWPRPRDEKSLFLAGPGDAPCHWAAGNHFPRGQAGVDLWYLTGLDDQFVLAKLHAFEALRRCGPRISANACLLLNGGNLCRNGLPRQTCGHLGCALLKVPFLQLIKKEINRNISFSCIDKYPDYVFTTCFETNAGFQNTCPMKTLCTCRGSRAEM